MSVTNYNVYRYTEGVNGFSLPLSNTVFSAKLAANTEQTVTAPLGAANGVLAQVKNKFIALVSPTSPVWVNNNATAAVPAGASFASTTSRLLPTGESGIYCKAGDVLHFISELANNSVSVAFYAIQE